METEAIQTVAAKVEERLAGIRAPEPGPLRLTDAEPSPVLVQIAAHQDRALLAALVDVVRDLAAEVEELRRAG
jgi:hypothetical protein